MKDEVSPQLWDQQGGFCRGRSCTDQIATFRIILEQSCELNSPLYVNSIDYEKAFDTLDRQSLWKLLRHYDMPEKITSIIRICYSGMTCSVVCGRELTDAFQVKAGAKHYLKGRSETKMPSFTLLFLLTIDWVLKTSTEEMEGSGLHGPNLIQT